MSSQPDWGKHGAIAAYIGIGVAILLVVTQEIWPPDPTHPLKLSFLWRSIPSWLVLLVVVLAVTITSVIWHQRVKRAHIQALANTVSNTVVTNLFEVHPTSLDDRVTDPKAGVGYTAKLRVSFANKSNETVRVLSPKWITAVGNVSVQCGVSPFPNFAYVESMMDFSYRYQFEEFQGSWKQSKWKKSSGKDDEQTEVTVAPGQTFRVWIGLNPCVPHKTLEALRKATGLGTLVLPVVIRGQEFEWKTTV